MLGHFKLSNWIRIHNSFKCEGQDILSRTYMLGTGKDYHLRLQAYTFPENYVCMFLRTHVLMNLSRAVSTNHSEWNQMGGLNRGGLLVH